MLDQPVGPLGVISDVHVGEPAQLGRHGHVGSAGEVPAAVLWSIHDQSLVSVVPVCGFLVFCVARYLDVLTGGPGIQIGVGGVLGDPALEIGS